MQSDIIFALISAFLLLTTIYCYFSCLFIFQVWIYALVAVTLISILGAVCVVIVPILNTCCFNYLFQFLIAIAFGTLCGDALLHLLPHVCYVMLHLILYVSINKISE